MNKISIIIPAYNIEKYIKRTIDSVCAQTYKNIEVIVVDDGSSDNTFTIINECANNDSRIVPVHQENGGVTSARLHGVKVATGEWIGFVDGDDTVDIDMYEFLISNAVKHNASISHCGFKMCFADGRVNLFRNTKDTLIQDTNKGLRDLLDGSIVEPSLCNKLYKRDLFGDFFYNNIDLSIRENEDLLMNYLLFSQSNLSVFVDECKYNYIVRANSSSRSINEHTIYDPIKVKSMITDLSPDNLKQIAKNAYLSTCVNTYCGLYNNKEFKDDADKVYKLICDIKESVSSLQRKNTKILAKLLIFDRTLFNIVYSIYEKFVQKKKYE